MGLTVGVIIIIIIIIIIKVIIVVWFAVVHRVEVVLSVYFVNQSAALKLVLLLMAGFGEVATRGVLLLSGGRGLDELSLLLLVFGFKQLGL